MKLKRIVLASRAGLLLMICPLAWASTSDNAFDFGLISKELGIELNAEDLERMRLEAVVGLHTYDVYINTQLLGSETIDVVPNNNNQTLSGFEAKIQAKVLQQLSLKHEELPELLALNPSDWIDDISHFLPGATVELNPDLQAIYIEIPQVYIDEKHRILLNPVLWDYGIPAWRLEYDANADINKYDGYEDKRAFVSFDSQINLGAWRLINRSNLRYDNNTGTEFDRLNTYVTRIVPSMKARVSIGEISTNSRFMDSIPIVGVSLREEDELIEPSDREYLPVINGIANSRSLVTLRQGNRIILEREVAPGPFEFADLQGLGYGGDIEVEVKDAGGNVRTWIVPYLRTTQLLKTGRFSWDIATGRYDAPDEYDNPWTATASAGYGMPGGYTLFGGFVASSIFKHVRTGVSADAGHLGTFTAQIDHSQKDTPLDTRKGSTAEIKWSKSFKKTNSSINLNYRRTFDGTIGSLSEAVFLNQSDRMTANWKAGDFVKDKVMLSLSQSLGQYGSLSASGIWERSNEGAKYQSLTANYSVNVKKCNLTLYVQRIKEELVGSGKRSDWQANVQLAVPLSIFEGTNGFVNRSSLQLSGSFDKDGNASRSVSISGPVFEESHFFYNLQAQKARNADINYYGSISWSGDKASMSANVSHSEDVTSYGFGVSGNLLLTQHGLFMTQSSYGSLALIHVPDAHDLELKNGNACGNEWAVASSLYDYQKNEVALNPDSLPANMTMVGGLTKVVIPADDAVLYHQFDSFIGTQALFTVVPDNGETIPFGSEVTLKDDSTGQNSTVSDDGGLVYFVSAPQNGEMKIRWRSSDKIHTCQAPFTIKAKDLAPDDLYRETISCHVIEGGSEVEKETGEQP